MKTDIRNRKDIMLLVNSFYDKVRMDVTIGRFFNEVVKINWEEHLPKMYSFWESVLFGTGGYKGNAIRKHLEVNRQSPLELKHFEQWLVLFKATVDEHFEGEKAAEVKQRAIAMSQLMLFKIGQSAEPTFIA
ncbi:group III truncated hemoglobin [Sediminibacterium ginsengisoli]|nr:group III truncated hemoglobin [Sediminibacterium ginsengisoli]